MVPSRGSGRAIPVELPTGKIFLICLMNTYNFGIPFIRNLEILGQVSEIDPKT